MPAARTPRQQIPLPTAIDRLDLEAAADADEETKLLLIEAKRKLAQVVREPYGGGFDTITDSLAEREFDPGLSVEDPVEKIIRIALTSLVYYPGQIIPWHYYVRWSTGTLTKEGSDAVRVVAKNVAKYRTAIESLGIPCIFWASFRKKATDINSQHGFRLTCSGDDVAEHVTMRDHVKMTKALNQLSRHTNASRFRAGMVKNPILRQYVTEQVEANEELQETAHYFTDNNPRHLLERGNTPTGGQ